MNALFDLQGKTAIVTGAGKGIGRSMALGLAQAGADVVLCSRTEKDLQDLAEEIESFGRRAIAVPCDVSKPEDIQEAVNITKREFGNIDILINNAGITQKAPAEEYALEDWNRIISVNLTGVFLFAQYAGREMIRQSGGRIINISSVGSQTALTGSLAYCVSKSGVNMMTKVLAMEWAQYGVLVNAIAPAYIETPMVKKITDMREGFSARVVGRTPLGRMGHPDELVGAAIFLASNASSYITGETIFVDGGWNTVGL